MTSRKEQTTQSDLLGPWTGFSMVVKIHIKAICSSRVLWGLPYWSVGLECTAPPLCPELQTTAS
jgi:hypothetical protein